MKKWSLLLLLTLALASVAQGQGRSNSRLTTLFASNSGFAGNVFDIKPAIDLKIRGIDVNCGTLGTPIDCEVWYRDGTSFGHESNLKGDWQLMGIYSGTGAGTDSPSRIDMAGNGVLFRASRTYGMFVYFSNYPASGSCRYTVGGPDTYNGDALSIVTNAGKSSPGWAGNTFFPRQWNGTIHYCAAGALTMTISDLAPEQSATIDVVGASIHGAVGVAYSLTGGSSSVITQEGCIVTTKLTEPVHSLTVLTADVLGNASGTITVPAGTNGMTVWIQAIDLDSCRMSNGLKMVIG